MPPIKTFCQLTSSTTSKNNILGLPLQAILPENLYKDLIAVIDDMQDTLSQRSFHFYQYNNVSYALSLSASQQDNYNDIGLEIEELDHTETPEKFFNTTTNLARVMEVLHQ